MGKGGKNFSLGRKIVYKYKCAEAGCEKEAKPVKVARTAWTKKMKIPAGMMWQCEDDHRHRGAIKDY